LLIFKEEKIVHTMFIEEVFSLSNSQPLNKNFLQAQVGHKGKSFVTLSTILREWGS